MKALLKCSIFGLCIVLGVSAALPLLPAATLAAPVGLVDGLWVMKKVDERYEGDDLQQELYLTLERVKQKGAAIRKMDVRWLEKDFGKQNGLIIHFLAPDYARGVTLSMTVKPYMDDDRWLYFPDTNIIRRVQARDQFSNFMGTDFTYYDLAEREPDEENHTLLRIEEYKGITCYVVETTPKERLPNGYSKKITWVDKDRFLKLRIDYFNAAGQLKKQFEASKWQEIDGVWTPLLMVMEDLMADHRTLIERRNVRYNQSVKDAFFQPQNVDCVTYKDGGFSLIPFDQRPTKVWEKKKIPTKIPPAAEQPAAAAAPSR